MPQLPSSHSSHVAADALGRQLGRVALIGAGPGAADLITVRGLRLLSQADVVLHDALVSQEMLDWCKPSAKLIAVGKRCGGLSTRQAFINKQMVDAAQSHALVVRLKGGDPMLFGRADEELRALEAAGIDYEIVPGITAALAASSALASPLTQRGVARSVVLTTYAKAAEEGADVAGLGADAVPITRPSAATADTLAVYMGRDQAVQIATQLLNDGWQPSTPVAVVEAVSTPNERQLRTTLSQVAQGYVRAWMSDTAPSLLLIGQALALRSAQSASADSTAASSPALWAADKVKLG